MFGDIDQFTDSAFFETHTTGTLYLPDKEFTLHIFALLETDAYDSWVYQCDFANRENGRKELLSYLKEQASQYRSISGMKSNTIIGMSTCADNSTNGRLILFAYAEEESVEQTDNANNSFE
jgi:sortase B